ncbi:protein FAR1-RELATED SEQUENCE 5-like [Chenopodium quinoa]|uniref:protein FAR1-RELATED SEQUENCE 5-like n=1 Tax=Chenopodium quinoa TaxID=63459 RepID=UPI000B78E560|nr:protein FAR1-RELATED SEQUENCE 5-like [Chenopodium quinoa]
MVQGISGFIIHFIFPPLDSKSEDGDGVDYSGHFLTDTVFSSFEDDVLWAQNVCRSLGFMLVKASYKTGQSGRPYRYVSCDRGKKSMIRDMMNTIRKDMKSKANICPFKLKVEYVRVVSGWKISCLNDAHNHSLAVYPVGHRQISGLSLAAKQVVRDMTQAQVPPRHIMRTLVEKFPGDHLNIRHVYNCRSNIRMERFEGSEVVHQVLHLARQSNYLTWVMTDTNNVLQHAFMAHPIMTNFLRTYPYVIGVDSTYKMNRYGMPFFEIVGVTPINQNFLVAYAFMRSESEESYRWVLQCLRLLIGHRRKPSVLLTDRELGLCAALKSVFPNTRHMLCSSDTVWAQVHCSIENQIIAIRNGLEACRATHGQKYKQKPLHQLNGKVSHYCLSILLGETNRMRGLSTNVHRRCGCALRTTHGLPSACQIYDLITAGKRLYTKNIHPYWRTLVIRAVVDIPDIVDENDEDRAYFRTLVDRVIASDPVMLRHVSRVIEGTGFDIRQCRYSYAIPNIIWPYVVSSGLQREVDQIRWDGDAWWTGALDGSTPGFFCYCHNMECGSDLLWSRK